MKKKPNLQKKRGRKNRNYMELIENLVINSFLSLGLTQNDAKVFLYIQTHPNCSGYDIAKNTTISRSLVYGILEKLRNYGFIHLTQGSASSYVAKSFEEIQYSINKKTESALSLLKDSLSQLEKPELPEDLFITLTERKNQIDKLSYMVKSAEKYLYISAGMRELDWIRNELLNLSDKIEVHIFSLSKIDEIFKEKFNVYSMEMESSFIQNIESLKDVWRIMVIKDEQELFLCGGDSYLKGAGIYTKNKMMVRFAVEHFIHDVKIYNIEKKYNITDDTHLKFQHKEKNKNF